MNNIKRNRGFTLFELLVSISIIAILVALATASYSSAQRKARDSRRMQDMEAVRRAAEQYYMLSSGSYPTANWSVGSSWAVSGQTVLQAFPQDPKGVAYTAPVTATTSTYCMCAYSEGGGGNCVNRDCNYQTSGTKNWYCVSNQQ